MNKFKLVTTAKLKDQTEAAVSKAAEKSFPGYRVAKIEDQGDKWQIRLDQEDKVSNRTRQAAPPPFEKKDDAGDSADAPDDESEESPDEEAAEDDGEKPDDDAESKDSEGGDKPKGKGEKKDPVKAIEGIMSELTSLLDELGGHASDLKEKADKVDEIHEMSKGDGDVDHMDSVPPVPPLDDAAAVGPTPGSGGPVPPRKPPVPGGGRPGMPPAGVPGVFGSRQTEIVEHPMKDDDGEYALGDVIAAIAAHPDLENYEIEELKALDESNVYVAKLKKKN